MTSVLSAKDVLVVLGTVFGLIVSAAGEDSATAHLKPILLHNGINEVQLDGAGLKATVVMARRDNFNAHSFQVTTIYVMVQAAGDDSAELKIVPIRNGDGKDSLNLVTGGGADCVLEDYRLMSDPVGHSAKLILARRRFGKSFADAQPVTFSYYRLVQNRNGDMGAPALYFQFEKKRRSKKSYCDVNEAFDAELKIGPDKGQARP